MSDAARMHGVVEALLTDLSGQPVTVVTSEPLAAPRGLVERLTLDHPIEGVGSTVVAKARSLGDWSEVNLASERSALLAVAAAGADVAPRFLAGHAGCGVLVMTDVGRVTVEELLFGSDRASAETALVELASATATLHGITVAAVPASHDTWTIGTHAICWEELSAAVVELGLPSPAAAADDAAAVIEALAAPGPFRTLVHGDLTPNNVVIGDDGRCRLVDFEGSTPQHLGVDACMLRFPFAWYGRWALLPRRVLIAMERSYRNAVGRDGDEIDAAIALGCAAMTLLRLQRLPRIADPRQAPEVALRRRVQIVSTVGVAADAAVQAGLVPKLVAWFRDLNAAMRDRWDEASRPPPVFPAFADGGGYTVTATGG